jgi:hypothetical protein
LFQKDPCHLSFVGRGSQGGPHGRDLLGYLSGDFFDDLVVQHRAFHHFFCFCYLHGSGTNSAEDDSAPLNPSVFSLFHSEGQGDDWKFKRISESPFEVKGLAGRRRDENFLQDLTFSQREGFFSFLGVEFLQGKRAFSRGACHLDLSIQGDQHGSHISTVRGMAHLWFSNDVTDISSGLITDGS